VSAKYFNKYEWIKSREKDYNKNKISSTFFNFGIDEAENPLEPFENYTEQELKSMEMVK
jgi:hypothetical protein